MKRIPHFYAFHCRLGMQNPPIYKKEFNLGIEDGPTAILSSAFLDTLSSPLVDMYQFPRPEDVKKENIISVIVDSINESKKLIELTITPHETQVVIGGDNSVTFPSILAVLNRVDPHALGYIQIDSHGDMNTYHDSISKNWHGMYLRPLFGDDFDIKQINNLVGRKLAHANTLFIGNLDLDPTEKEFFESTHITHLALSNLRKEKQQSQSLIYNLLTRIQHLHVTIDIDAFDKSIAPATGLPAEEGLLYEDIQELLKMFKEAPSLSIDLVEVNPHKEGAEKTITFAQSLLHELLT